MLPDSVSWGRGSDHPLVVFRPETEGGHFEGVLGTSPPIVGGRLAVSGFTVEQAKSIEAAIENRVPGLEIVSAIVSSKVEACAEVAGKYTLRDSKASILANQRATRVSESTIVEVNE